MRVWGGRPFLGQVLCRKSSSPTLRPRVSSLGDACEGLYCVLRTCLAVASRPAQSYLPSNSATKVLSQTGVSDPERVNAFAFHASFGLRKWVLPADRQRTVRKVQTPSELDLKTMLKAALPGSLRGCTKVFSCPAVFQVVIQRPLSHTML